MLPSQPWGAPAALSPMPWLGTAAKAPARRDGTLRVGGRAGAFGQPSGVWTAAAVGAHVNSTRVQGGRSAPCVPVPSACPHPLLHQSPDSSGCDPFMRWQHPTVPLVTRANPEPPHTVAAPVSPGQPSQLNLQPCSACSHAPPMPQDPTKCPHEHWFGCTTLAGPPACHHQTPCSGHAAPHAPPAAWAWTCRPTPGMLGPVPAHGSTTLLPWQPGQRAEGTASPTGTCCWKRRAPSGTLTSPGTPVSSPDGWQCWGHTSEAEVLDTFEVAVGLLLPITPSPSRDDAHRPAPMPPSPCRGCLSLAPFSQGRHDSPGAFRQNNPPPAPPLLPLGIPGRAPAAKSHFRSPVGPPARSHWLAAPHCWGCLGQAGPPQPLIPGSTVGVVPLCLPGVGWGNGRSPAELSTRLWPKAARLCQTRQPQESGAAGTAGAQTKHPEEDKTKCP